MITERLCFLCGDLDNFWDSVCKRKVYALSGVVCICRMFPDNRINSPAGIYIADLSAARSIISLPVYPLFMMLQLGGIIYLYIYTIIQYICTTTLYYIYVYITCCYLE